MRGDIVKKSIYVIKNKINDKVYVGQAKDPQHRFISHLSRAKTNADNSPIHDAINKLEGDVVLTTINALKTS